MGFVQGILINWLENIKLLFQFLLVIRYQTEQAVPIIDCWKFMAIPWGKACFFQPQAPLWLSLHKLMWAQCEKHMAHGTPWGDVVSTHSR